MWDHARSTTWAQTPPLVAARAGTSRASRLTWLCTNHHRAVGRQLERWEAPSDTGPAIGLEDDDGTRWDQFEANKRLFNVTTTFKEVPQSCALVLPHNITPPGALLHQI